MSIGIVLGSVVLATLATFSPMKGGPGADGPMPPSDDVWELVIYEDDPVWGAHLCREAVIEYAPAVCTVEPEGWAPDVTVPGWALPYGPSWSDL
jgi:hypothetical protein